MSVPSRRAVVLRFRARPGRREELLAFLARAFPFYESPGDTRMSLWRDRADPDRFVEVAVNPDEEAFAAMDSRVRRDPETLRVLAGWRDLIEDLEVETLEEVVLPPEPRRAM